MNKTYAKLWFAFFGAWGQYIRERKYKTFVLNNISNIVIWTLAFLYFNQLLFEVNTSSLNFLIFVISIKWLISSLEKYIDAPVPYTLYKRLPLKIIEVFQIRVINKYIWPSEMFLSFLIFFHFYKNEYSMYFLIIYYLLLIISDELIAFFAYEYSGSIISSIVSLELMIFTFIPSLFSTYFKTILCINILSFFVTKKLLISLRRNHQFKRSLKLVYKTITLRKQFILKEYIYLFIHKKSILITDFFTVMVFILLNYGDKDKYTVGFYSIFFIFQFALSYGFNYLEVEKRDIVLICNQLNTFTTFLRVKSLFFITISVIGSIFIAAIEIVFFKVSILGTLKIIPDLFFAASIFCFLSHWNSINNFPFSKKQNIKKFFTGILAFIFIVTIQTILIYKPSITRSYYSVFSLFSFICLYYSLFNLDYFSNRIIKKRENILRYITMNN